MRNALIGLLSGPDFPKKIGKQLEFKGLDALACDELKSDQGEVMEIKNGVLSLIAASGIVTGIAYSAHAQNYTVIQSQPDRSERSDSDEDNDSRFNLYHACELSVDGSAIGVLHADDFNSAGLNRRNYRFGGDAGGSFFLTKYIGVGADAFTLTGAHPTFVDTLTGNLIFRIPIEDTGLAPYVFGGAGYRFERVDGIVGGGGVGLEFRIVRHFGIFADARYLASVKTRDYGLARAGVRISF